MKKILFCAAVVALAAACTNEDDLVMNQDNSRTKGLTFDVALAEGAVTKGELWKDENGTYPFFWYAETDRINVLALTNVSNTADKGVAAEETQSVNEAQVGTGVWTLPTDGAASYKATQSSGNGKFTSVDDNNLITLTDVYDSTNKAGTTTTIVATYGDVKASAITSKRDKDGIVPGELTSLVLTTTESNATQEVDRANTVNAPMYSVSTAIKEEVYNSLGERANLSLIRPFPVIRFTTANTKDYIKDFGKLKSVELTALGVLSGTIKDGKYTSVEGTASTLAYADNKEYIVVGSDQTGFKPGFEVTSSTSDGTTIAPEKATVKLTDGTWSDDDAVYMTVAPVSRKELNGKEAFKIVYEFENITFTLDPSRKGAEDFEKALQTSNDWTTFDAAGNPNAITALPALDINNYNYLVTNGTTTTTGEGDQQVSETTGRVLIVIKGNFNDVFADKNNVAWNGESIPVGEFSKIISKVALTNAELATIKSFDNLTDLTLAENTAIPANTFNETQTGNITSLNLPKVTSVAKDFAAAGKTFAKLNTLIMPAYEFNDAHVNSILLNTVEATAPELDNGVKNNKLTTLDMSGVTSMMPTFGVERTMTFNGYTALKTVTVKDGVIVAPNGFAGCTALTTINGKLDISSASAAFKMGATDVTDNNTLTSVEVCGTEIPDEAFLNCGALETVKYNGSAIVPTAIGESAFENTVVEHMDLSKAATIGKAAFKGSQLTSTSKTVATLTVGATKLTESMFEGTNVRMVKFTDATQITGNDVFKNAGELIQVKFEKVFALATSNTNIYTNVFGENTGKIDFWTNPSQTGVSGNKLSLNWKTGANNTQEYTFKSIQKRLD